MVTGGTGLKDGFMFQRPLRSWHRLPGLQGREERFHFAEVFPVISAKIQPRSLPCPAGHRLEEFRLQQAVFMMALLGPGIGKKHPDFLQGDVCRQGVQQFAGFRANEMAMREPGPMGFAPRSLDPITA